MKIRKKGKGIVTKKVATATIAVFIGVGVFPINSITTLATTNTMALQQNNNTESGQDYDSVFRIQNQDILSFSNNAGAYNNSPLSNMFDGNTSTHWETNKPNTSTFKNNVVVKFKEEVTIDRVYYYSRVKGAANKGFPTKFSIYSSLEDEGENFTLVYSGTSTVTSEKLEIRFNNEAKFKRLKFVFDESYQNWSAASELQFYKPDYLANKANNLFTDGTMTEVKSGVTLAEVNSMLEEAKIHPDKNLMEKIQMAKYILEGGNLRQEVFSIEQRGNGVYHARNILKTSSYGTNLLPTGRAALAGEEIKVYVDGEAGKPLPQITFSQQVGHWNAWQRTYNLKQGENIFIVPKIYSENWSHKVIAGGAIYLVNPYTEAAQGEAPRIRIEGGHKYPIFYDGEDVNQFKKELQEYKVKLTEESNKYVDIVELVNDYAIINSNMKSAEVALLNSNQTAQGSLDFHAERLSKYFKYAGISEEGEINHIRNGARANLRLMQPWAFAYASGDHTGFQQESANTLFAGKLYGWAIAHELGHHFDVKDGFIGEVTNNMWANYNIVDLQNGPDRVEGSYDTIFTRHASDNYATLTQNTSINTLSVWWQLHLLDTNYWAKYQAAYREGIAGNMGLNKNERMALVSSYAIGFDVTEHFERHKFINEASAVKVRNAIKELNIPEAAENIKPWYMWTKATKDRVSKFEQNYKPEITSIEKKDGKVEIKMNIDESAKNALLGYEVIQDGKVIGFTRTNTFKTVENVEAGEHSYKVRAFDLRLNVSQYSETKVIN